MCQNFANLISITTILVLDWRKWPFWEFLTFYVPLCSKKLSVHWHKEKVLYFNIWNQYTLLHSSNKLTFDISSSTDLVWRHFIVDNISDVLIEQFNWLTYFWCRPGSDFVFSIFIIGISKEPLMTIAALKRSLLCWDANW